MKTGHLFSTVFHTNKNIKNHGLLKTLLLASGMMLWGGAVHAQYCTPANTIGCAEGDDYQTFITTGGVTNIDHEPGGACVGNDSGYAQFSGVGLSGSGMHGTTISFSILNNIIWPEGYAIWVDWNQDNVFDPSEEVFATSGPIMGDSVANGSFAIPADALLGTTTLRIRCIFDTAGAFLDPCTATKFGITFDFPLTVLNTEPVFVNGSPQPFVIC
jgi:hypothetical protein